MRTALVIECGGAGEQFRCVIPPLLLHGDPPQLENRIGFAAVDLGGAREALLGFVKLSPLHVHQTDLVVRIGIPRIGSGNLQLTAQVLASPEAITESAHIGSKKNVGVIQEER